jgi:hypothetical protein
MSLMYIDMNVAVILIRSTGTWSCMEAGRVRSLDLFVSFSQLSFKLHVHHNLQNLNQL